MTPTCAPGWTFLHLVYRCTSLRETFEGAGVAQQQQLSKRNP